MILYAEFYISGNQNVCLAFQDAAFQDVLPVLTEIKTVYKFVGYYDQEFF